jgi:hypothetical protein
MQNPQFMLYSISKLIIDNKHISKPHNYPIKPISHPPIKKPIFLFLKKSLKNSPTIKKTIKYNT